MDEPHPAAALGPESIRTISRYRHVRRHSDVLVDTEAAGYQLEGQAVARA